MANVCDNKFYIYSEESVDSIKVKLTELLDTTLEGYIDYSDYNIIEGWFSSRWVFPTDLFKDFFNEFNDDSIYMRCLSEEYGCGYVAMNIFENNGWKDEQCFNL